MDSGAAGLILDTNAVSALAKDDPRIRPVLASVTRQLALPVVVIGEYHYGIGQSNQSAHLKKWLEAFVGDCQVLDIIKETAQHYAEISTELRKIGKPIPDNDIWIAALSREHALPLLSRDAHFDVVRDLKRLSW